MSLLCTRSLCKVLKGNINPNHIVLHVPVQVPNTPSHRLVRRSHTFSGSNRSVLIRCLWSKSNRSIEDSNTASSMQVCQSVPLVCHGVPKIRGKHHGTFENYIFLKVAFRNYMGFRSDPEDIVRQSYQAQNAL